MSIYDHVRAYFASKAQRRAEAAPVLAEYAGAAADLHALCPACASPCHFRAAQHRDGSPLAVYACPTCGLIWSRSTSHEHPQA